MANLATPTTLPSKALGAAGILYGHDPLDPTIANSIRVDATGALVVTTTGGAVPASAAQTSVIAYYTGTLAGPGYNVGDILRETQIVDPGTGTVVSSIWTNMTTGQPIAAPAMTNVAFQPNEPLTNTELRAAPVAVIDTPVLQAIQALQLQMATMLGNTDQLEALTTQTNSLLTLLNTYNDQVEGLLTGITSNVDGLEPLINLLNTYNDQVEPLLTQISAQLPTTLGQKVTTNSLSVVLASDQVMNLPTGAATEAKQDIQIDQLTDLNLSVATEFTLAALELKAATEATLRELTDKAATESSLVNLITHFPPGIGPYQPNQSLSVYVSNAAELSGQAAVAPAQNMLSTTYVAAATDSSIPSQYSAGDTIQLVQVVDTTTTPYTIVSETWFNSTTGLPLSTTTPTMADLIVNSSGLTDFELRAAPVEVFVVNMPPPGGSVTTNNSYSQTLTAIADDTTNVPAEYVTGDVITYNAVYDESQTPPLLISETYFNETTQTYITQPSALNIAAVAESGLTDSELRAAPVDVFVVNQPAPTPITTTNNAYTETYTAFGTGPDYAPGDVLQREVIVDESTTPATILSETWYNVTTNTVLSAPPLDNTFAYAPAGALTNAELRAAPVDVYVVNQVAPGGSVTTNNIYEQTLTAIGTDPTSPAQYSAGDTITYNAVYNEATDPPTLISETYYNETTGQVITNPVDPTLVAIQPTNPLTNAELRAEAVHVIVDNSTPTNPVTTYETEMFTYVALQTDTVGQDYSIGDILQCVQTLDNSTSPATIVSTTWTNLSTNAVITAPATGAVSLQASTGLTNAELRSVPVDVYVVNQVAPGGSVTENVSYTETLSALTTDTAVPSQWTVGDTITYNAVYDESVSPAALISETYFNETTQQFITNPIDTTADIAIAPVGALTNAELRASDVGVTDAQVLAELLKKGDRVSDDALSVYVVNQGQVESPVVPATFLQMFVDSYQAVADDSIHTPPEFLAGETLQNIIIADTSVSPAAVQSNVWNNLSQGTVLTSAPTAVSIMAIPTNPLTNTELRADAVHVIVDNQASATPTLPAPTTYTVESFTYIALTADAIAPIEYAAGDVLQCVQTIDATVSPVQVLSEVWKNLTSGATMTQVPTASSIAMTSNTGLTNAELRATPVDVYVVNQPAPVTPATQFQFFSDNFIATAADTTVPIEFATGDYLSREVKYDTSTGTVVSEVWKNLTSGAVMTQAPASSAIAATPTSGLTDAELRASAIHVIVDNQVTLPAAATVTTKQTIFETYTATANDATAPVEYLAGDVLDRTLVVDNATAPATILSDVWTNTRTGLTLTSPPAGASVAQNSTAALTDAELRASPVDVYVVNQPTPAPSATQFQFFSDNFIATAGDATAPIEFAAGDYLSREVKYDTSTGTVVTTVWKNLTSGATMIQAPAAASIAQAPSSGLTDAELRAAAIHVIVDNQVPSTPAPTSFSVESFTYIATSNDATVPFEYVAGDVLQNVQTIDATVSPVVVVSSVWTNLTTGGTLTQIPSASTIASAPTSGLTNAELRATPVEVFVVNQTQAAPVTAQQVVTELYSVITSGVGYTVGDVVRRTVVMNTAVAPATVVSQTWENVTTGLALASAPVAGHIAMKQASAGLTDSELRATPVKVEDDVLAAVLPPARGPQTDSQSLSVYVSNQPTNSLRILSTNYLAIADDVTAPLQYVTGQYLQRIQVFDISTSPVSLSSDVWTNLNTNVTLSGAPDFATIEYSSSGDQALTDNQLRASAVHVVVDNMPAPVTAQTSNQMYVDSYTALVDDPTNTPKQYLAGDRLRNTIVADASQSPVAIISNTWENVTQGTAISAPSGGTIAMTPASALTDTELRASPVEVFVTNQITVPTVTNKTMVVENYVVITSGTGYSVNDILRRTAIVDTSTSPETITETWFNVTTGSAIGTPVAGHIAAQSSSALTDAELRSSAVHVIVDNQNPPAPTVTTNELFIQTFQAIATDTVHTPAEFTAGDTIKLESIYNGTTLISETWTNLSTGQVINTPIGTALASAPATTPQTVQTVTRNIQIVRFSGSVNTIPAGAREIAFAVESGSAVVQGQVFVAGYSLEFSCDSPGEILGQFAIDATNGTVLATIVS